MRIKYKISLIAAIMCIVCVGALWAVNKFISSEYLKDTLQDKVLAEVKLKAHDIDEWIVKEKQNLDIVAERVIMAEDYNFDALYKVLEKTGDMNFGNLYYMAFDDGTIIDASGLIPDGDHNLLTREWYVKAKENSGKIYVCDPYVDAKTHDLVLTLSKEITLRDGRIAVLGVDMQISNMNELVYYIGQHAVDTVTSATRNSADFESTINDADKSYIFLIDRHGNIINHPNPEFSAKPDKVTNAADILGGKINDLKNSRNLSLNQRIIKDYDGVERAFFIDTLDESGWGLGIAVNKDAILEAEYKFARITLILSIILLCAGIVVSLITAGNIAKPVMAAKTMANNISMLKLNMDIDDTYLKRKDEAGEIVKAVKETMDKLRNFTADLNELSAINNKIYNTTLEKTSKLLSLSEGVLASTQELSAGMEETSAAAVTITQSVDELNSAMSVFAGKAEEGAKTANEMARKAVELDRQFIESKNNTMNILNMAKDEVESAVESAKNVEQVKILADVILDIAKKTKLLSLNASIEAANAGENGKGFRVVAEQVKALSEESDKSAGRIKQFVEEINISVNKLILATSNLLKFMDKNVLSDYSLMLTAIENYKNDGSALSVVLSELSNTVKELTATINNVAMSINDVSATIQQATAASADIAGQNSETVGAIQDINNAMQMNMESSDKLANMIAQVEL